MNDIRTKILTTLRKNFEAGIEKHVTNIEIMLANPIAIHDHTNYISAIEAELAQIAEYTDKLEALNFLSEGTYDSVYTGSLK